MTYLDLINRLKELPEELQNTDVTVLSDGEYFGNIELKFCDDGCLDDAHPYLSINENPS